MSTLHNSWFHQLETVRASLERATFYRDNTPLSRQDAATWVEALLLQYVLMEDLSSVIPIGLRERRQWTSQMVHVDVLEVVSVLKKVDSYLTLHWERPEMLASPGDFKHRLRQDFPHVGAILAPIWKHLCSFCTMPGVSEYRALHQWCCFLGRVSFRDISDEDVIEDFKATDVGLASPDFSLARALNRVLREWLSGFTVDTLPQHGPGSTADAGRGSLLRKYQHLGTDQLLEYVLRKNGWDPTCLVPCNASWARIAKLQCVPKTALTKRTICMEPATLQYFQQMVQLSLYRFFEKKKQIRRHIRLRDQGQNRQAARIGSMLGTIATIDLSKASDSVTWDLARVAFRGTTLLPWLYATRSRAVEVRPGETVELRKFAPMGSALCFPIECLIFAATCEVATREFGRYCSFPYYSVYGDDIAITTDLVPVVVSYLTQLGFTVNADKSFKRDSIECFRESCGVEYVGGIDVKPLRIPRGFEGGRLDSRHPGRVETLVDFANACLSKGFLGCRSVILHRLQALPQRLLPVWGETDSSLHSPDVTNWRNKHRWSRRLQRAEVLGGSTHVDTSETPVEYEPIRLFHWLLTAEHTSDRLDPLVSDIGQIGRPALESAWLAASWL
jgi:hypothetical protein